MNFVNTLFSSQFLLSPYTGIGVVYFLVDLIGRMNGDSYRKNPVIGQKQVEVHPPVP